MTAVELYRYERDKRAGTLAKQRAALQAEVDARYARAVETLTPKRGRPRKSGALFIDVRQAPPKPILRPLCNRCGENPRARSDRWCLPCKRVRRKELEAMRANKCPA